MNFEVNGFAVL